jgi:hypothetical protein
MVTMRTGTERTGRWFWLVVVGLELSLADTPFASVPGAVEESCVRFGLDGIKPGAVGG